MDISGTLPVEYITLIAVENEWQSLLSRPKGHHHHHVCINVCMHVCVRACMYVLVLSIQIGELYAFSLYLFAIWPKQLKATHTPNPTSPRRHTYHHYHLNNNKVKRCFPFIFCLLPSHTGVKPAELYVTTICWRIAAVQMRWSSPCCNARVLVRSPATRDLQNCAIFLDYFTISRLKVDVKGTSIIEIRLVEWLPC